MTAVVDPPRAAESRPAARAGEHGRFGWLRERGMGATVLVSAISTAFGVVLMSATGYIAAALQANPFYGESRTLAAIVGILGAMFLVIAVYVASIVTANTFATIIAGRTRRIALMRLIGASARSQRSTVAREGLIVGAIGAAVGLVVATIGVVAAVPLLDRVLGVTSGYDAVQPLLAVPAVGVALTTWAAAWAGSRRVLDVTPLQALGGSVEQTHEDIVRRPIRNRVLVAVGIVGVLLLAGGVALGLVTPLGVLVAFVGGLLSFTALSLGASAVMPPLLALTGRLFGSSVTARLAAQNALRYPERSSRMAIGVVMGVALVVMFAVASESAKQLVAASSGPGEDAYFAAMMDSFAGVMIALVAVSAVIAAVGLVNLLTIGIVQRRRELALLRALGLTARQVRRMVLVEAAHVTVTALVFGLVLGVAYGWAGAQSLLGSVAMPPAWQAPTFVAPGVPWVTVAIVVAATTVLTLVAAVAPTRIATRTAPIEALAE